MNIEQVYRIVRRSIKEYGVVVVPLFSVLIYFWGYIFRYGFFDYYNISAEYIDVNLNEFILNCCYVFGLIIMIRLIIYISNYNFLYIILLKIFNKRKDKGSILRNRTVIDNIKEVCRVFSTFIIISVIITVVVFVFISVNNGLIFQESYRKILQFLKFIFINSLPINVFLTFTAEIVHIFSYFSKEIEEKVIKKEGGISKLINKVIKKLEQHKDASILVMIIVLVLFFTVIVYFCGLIFVEANQPNRYIAFDIQDNNVPNIAKKEENIFYVKNGKNKNKMYYLYYVISENKDYLVLKQIYHNKKSVINFQSEDWINSPTYIINKSDHRIIYMLKSSLNVKDSLDKNGLIIKRAD